MTKGERIHTEMFQYSYNMGAKKCCRCGKVLLDEGYRDPKGHVLCRLCRSELENRKVFYTNF